MTILYKPALIETVEQAEALPVGSVSPPSHPDDKPAVKITEVLWVSVWGVDDDHDLTYEVAPNNHMVNDLVLVPVEAGECHSEDYGSYHLMEAVDGPKPFTAYLVDQEEA